MYHSVGRSHAVSCWDLYGCCLPVAWVLRQVSHFADAGSVRHKNEPVSSASYVCLLGGVGDRDNSYAGGK